MKTTQDSAASHRDQTRVREHAERETARSDERSELADERLRRLYEISKLLTRFEGGVEQTVPAVIAVLAQTLPLASAVFLVATATPSAPHSIVWQLLGENSNRLRMATAHAQRSYDYLVQSAHKSTPYTHENGLEIAPERTSKRNYIFIPLVVDQRPIFGGLHLDGVADFNELDLMFVNAVVNQLAIAVDRHAILEARQLSADTARARAETDRAAAEAHRADADVKRAAAALAENRQRVLAEVSAILAASLDYRTALLALTHFAVPLLGDLCFIDERREDGTVQRMAVLFADARKQRELADEIMALSPRAGSQTPQAEVLESGRSVLLSEIDELLSVVDTEAHAEVMRATGWKSMMVVPLHARGRTFGALSFIAAESDRRYSAIDLALATDIGDRAGLAIDNLNLYEHAQCATRSRENLLALVSHDLKNPLAIILLGIGALLDTQGHDERRSSKKQLAVIKRSAESMDRLVQDLLDTSSIEAGHLSMELAPVHVTPLVSDAIEVFYPLAATRTVQIKSELPDESLEVAADAARLQQVLANLLGNALKFTPPGGTITVRAERRDDAMTFSVADTGVGIDARELGHVFDRFWQARPTARLGTGLGLFIVKGIIEAQSGTVWVESTLGMGSTFFFSLPLAAHWSVH